MDRSHNEGMKPDETWDAQMLMDWLDDKLTKDIYNVTNVYTRAETILDKLKEDDPAAYARFTEGAKNAEYVETCHKWALDAEQVEEQARFYRKRVNEYTVVIEQNTETLSNGSAELFDYEKTACRNRFGKLHRPLRICATTFWASLSHRCLSSSRVRP